MVPARLVLLPDGDPVVALAHYLRRAAETGHWVLLITARTGGPELLRRLPELGVDLDRLLILDVVTDPSHARHADAQHLHFVPSPNLLELLILRGERLVWKRRKEHTRIATYDLNGFGLHNPPEAIEQMVRYALTRVRSYTWLDYFVDGVHPLPERLRVAMEGLAGPPVPLVDVLAQPAPSEAAPPEP